MAGSQFGSWTDERSGELKPIEGLTLATTLLWVQGVYYLVTGLWPLLSIESFQAVTGPKTDHLVTGRESDHWLVMTVAVLIVSVAATLLYAAWRRSNQPEVAVLAISSALALTGVDVVYVLRGVIAPIYLADAVVEIVLIATWIVALARKTGIAPLVAPQRMALRS